MTGGRRRAILDAVGATRRQVSGTGVVLAVPALLAGLR
jgi:hypothetical protein